MTLSYPLDFPSPPTDLNVTLGIKSWSVFFDNADSRSPSPPSFQEQIYSHSGERLRLQVAWNTLKLAEAADIVGWLAALDGAVGTFRFGGDPMMMSPRGAAIGNPTVNGANQKGKLLATTGWQANTTGILLRGDWFQLENYLYLVTKNVDSDGSGNATLDIFPRLRGVPLDGDGLVTNNPTGIFRMDASTQSYQGQLGPIYSISISATEAI